MNEDLRRTLGVVAGGLTLCVALVSASLLWPQPFLIPGIRSYLPPISSGTPSYPFFELLKLVVAGILGIVVTTVHRYFRHFGLPSRSLEQSQVLLCMAGAFVMIIIGDSLARAFGVVGAAGVVRFRTPVENPRDAAVLFLSIGIGMACGMNAFGLAGLMSLLVCAALGVLHYLARHRPRALELAVVTDGPEVSLDDVQRVLSELGIAWEPRGTSKGKKTTTTTYVIDMPPRVTLPVLHRALVGITSTQILSVSWQQRVR